MKPNIILITTDQQRKDSMSGYGFSNAQTPHLDRLAKEGVVFERSYCTSPVCTPSRASLYSGKYVSKHGAWNVGTALPEDEKLLSHRLTEAGYRTHHIGKAHFQPYLSPLEQSRESILTGWEQNFESFDGPYYGFQTVELAMGHSLYGGCGHYGMWLKQRSGRTTFEASSDCREKFGGEAYDWQIKESDHSSWWTAERAAVFLKEQKERAEQPFFLSIGFQDPHHPHAVPVERTGKINKSAMQHPQYMEGELQDKPPHFEAVHAGDWSPDHPMHGMFPMAGQSSNRFDYRLVHEEDAIKGKAYYYAMVEMIDEAVGRILQALNQNELDQNTIIIFTTDHGELLGDHGIWMKGPFHYEQLVNIPFIIHGPSYFPAGRADAIISLVDVVPTILELCEISIPSGLDGVSFKQLLLGQSASIRAAALIEHVDDPGGLRLKTVVTERYKCTIYYGEYGKQAGELYDLFEDPAEMINLWGNAQYNGIKFSMMHLLLQELEKLERREGRDVYA
ncbi:sulfatase family protein [Paenibacillus sp. GXUN7292]|uniref:sulfatase family protein n=1 Tax=Paenibacillus sp. GXUN7292 TaxID=3422499 RepID=UPI003D7F0C16